MINTFPKIARYSCILIDDDVLALQVLINIVQVPELSLRAAYQDACPAISDIQPGRQVDLLFLGIGMPISGVDVARMDS